MPNWKREFAGRRSEGVDYNGDGDGDGDEEVAVQIYVFLRVIEIKIEFIIMAQSVNRNWLCRGSTEDEFFLHIL